MFEHDHNDRMNIVASIMYKNEDCTDHTVIKEFFKKYSNVFVVFLDCPSDERCDNDKLFIKATLDDFESISTELLDSFDFFWFDLSFYRPIKDDIFVRFLQLSDHEDFIDWFQQECTRLNIFNEYVGEYWVGGYPSCPIIHKVFYTEGTSDSLDELCTLKYSHTNGEIERIRCLYDEEWY